MSGVKLFRLRDGDAVELNSAPVVLDGSLQRLVEPNMETMFGVRLLASGYSTGSRHGGRIGSIGLDENGTPVVVEYERAGSANVVTEGVYFLDWLVDHRADVTLLVMDRLGPGVAADVDWRSPRLICVATGFTRADEHIVRQISRSIELVRCSDFEDGLVALELVAPARSDGSAGLAAPTSASLTRSTTAGHTAYRTVAEELGQAPPMLRMLYAELEDYVESLGADVSHRVLDTYVAFRRLRNFTCVEVDLREEALLLYLRLDPDSVELEAGFTRDVRSLGHFGTGFLEVRVPDADAMARALPLVRASYLAG